MDVYKAIVDCLGGWHSYQENVKFCSTSENKEVAISTTATEVQTAETILLALLTSEKLGKDLDTQLQNIVKASGLVYINGLWYEGLIRILLERLESLIKNGQDAKFTGAAKESFDKAKEIVEDFVHKHPVLTSAIVTLLMLGLLMYAAPWAVEALGFTLEGLLTDSFTAGWQSTLGDVEAGSWFAFWQRLGMTWGK